LFFPPKDRSYENTISPSKKSLNFSPSKFQSTVTKGVNMIF